MPYVGRSTDKISNVEVLDNITFDGSSSYTLQKNSVNFTPSSANTLLLSIDGVVQAGNFTVSGSTIDFGTAVAGTSTCDFILHYGVGLITTPSDGTVTTALQMMLLHCRRCRLLQILQMLLLTFSNRN
jgi:hypothetical protein